MKEKPKSSTKEDAPKEEKRKDTPLAETPKTKITNLKETIKAIEVNSNARREASAKARAESKAKYADRKEKRVAGGGGTIQGLNTALGGKIIRKR